MHQNTSAFKSFSTKGVVGTEVASIGSLNFQFVFRGDATLRDPLPGLAYRCPGDDDPAFKIYYINMGATYSISSLLLLKAETANLPSSSYVSNAKSITNIKDARLSTQPARI